MFPTTARYVAYTKEQSFHCLYIQFLQILFQMTVKSNVGLESCTWHKNKNNSDTILNKYQQDNSSRYQLEALGCTLV